MVSKAHSDWWARLHSIKLCRWRWQQPRISGVSVTIKIHSVNSFAVFIYFYFSGVSYCISCVTCRWLLDLSYRCEDLCIFSVLLLIRNVTIRLTALASLVTLTFDLDLWPLLFNPWWSSLTLFEASGSKVTLQLEWKWMDTTDCITCATNVRNWWWRPLCARSWWFAIDRREADKQLMLPGNPRGTFLIRNSTGEASKQLHLIHLCIWMFEGIELLARMRMTRLQCCTGNGYRVLV